MRKFLILFTFLFWLSACGSEKSETRPNVVFILADDLGYRDLGFMGSEYYETPNIDQLAGESVVFTNGYAACRVCSPSRGSIMSGKFPARHGITDWIGAASGEDWRKKDRYDKLLPAEYEHKLANEYVTLPEAMREAGYKTFFAGKWHLGEKGSWPQNHGFDINIGGWGAGSPKGGYFDPYQNPNLENRNPGENLSMRLAKETVRFLNENNPEETGQPVFAFLSFYAVHGPIQTTREKWKKYRDKADEMGIAESGFEMGPVLPARVVQDNPVYGGLVEAMDDAVGQVMNTLEDLGLSENTIVVFTSDNGGVVSGDAYATSNLPLSGGKGQQYEGGIREPYLIMVPGIKGGQKCDAPVTGTDFYPTILELTNQELRPEEHNDGVSLVPLLQGDTIEERALIWHYPHYGNQGGAPSSIIRKGDWKLIYYYEDKKLELFNVQEDPGEIQNLISRKPELAAELKNELMSYLQDVGAKFPAEDPLYNETKRQERLQWLKTTKKKQLEKQRMRFLQNDFDPGNNWWGSNVE